MSDFDIAALTDDDLIHRQLDLQKKMMIAARMGSCGTDVLQILYDQVQAERTLRLSAKVWNSYIDSTPSVVSTQDEAKTEKKTTTKKNFKRIEGSPIIKTSAPSGTANKDK